MLDPHIFTVLGVSLGMNLLLEGLHWASVFILSFFQDLKEAICSQMMEQKGGQGGSSKRKLKSKEKCKTVAGYEISRLGLRVYIANAICSVSVPCCCWDVISMG
jgi:hypothetical protein